MRIYVAVTDTNWYQQLSSLRADEVNFWNPGGHPLLKDLRENEMVLFKLKAPYSKIAGGGFFVRFIQLPVFLAWQTFGGKNGTRTMEDLLASLPSRNSHRVHDPHGPILAGRERLVCRSGVRRKHHARQGV